MTNDNRLSPLPIAVRRAQPDDAELLARLNEAVQQIHHEALPQRYKPAQPDDPTLIAWYAHMLTRSDVVIFIAETAQEAVGYAVCLIQDLSETPFRYGSKKVHIDQLAVQTSYQRMGIGGILLENVLALATDHNAERITLGVLAFNEQAIAFYRRHAFKIESMTMELVL